MIGRVRQYGDPPYRVAVIHGGPGAPGSVAPIAWELAKDMGVLEPIQTALAVDGQVEELRAQLEANADPPVALIGHSWGAMLSYAFGGRYPDMVGKIIMVCSGTFERKYSDEYHATRMSRVAPENREEAADLMEHLRSGDVPDRDAFLSRLGEIMSGTDHYDPLPHKPDPDPLEFMPEVHTSVWQDAVRLRDSGELVRMGAGITCPVVVIHGDYDPHPVDGVLKPLFPILGDLRPIMLEKCGHEPWTERHARDRFFETLRAELGA